jgi:hypothetical protein
MLDRRMHDGWRVYTLLLPLFFLDRQGAATASRHDTRN